MSQHFLLSAAARTLSLRTIYEEREDAAYRRFCRLRWPETGGAPVCPLCGCLDIYDLSTRRRFKCAACHRQFSVTSGTVFASRKLAFVDLLGAVCLFVNAAKGLSAVQLSRDMDVQHNRRRPWPRWGRESVGDAFVLMHKLRETMTWETRETRLEGEVEVDGAVFGCQVRSANARDDRRLLANRSGKRRVAVVLRQRGGRTLPRSFLREAQAVDFARERIASGSVISADEVAHWDVLEPDFEMKRVNHSDAYSREGVHTNLAESYFSRLRRMIGGQHIRVEGRYLDAYAAHAAWLEDHRFDSNGGLADRLIGGAMAVPVSRAWKGYWQRRAA